MKRRETRDSLRAANDWARVTTELPAHDYLIPAIRQALQGAPGGRVLDMGCGDGRLTAKLQAAGWKMTGFDLSDAGIARAGNENPGPDYFESAMGTPLTVERAGRYDAVICVEVIEHLLLPRHVFWRAAESLKPGAPLVISTPFHGYWKNLALALSGRLDHHWMVDKDYGHIKFFSPQTLSAMASECGFETESIRRVGRVAPLAASMVGTFKVQP